MTVPSPQSNTSLQSLLTFPGAPKAFWEAWLQACAQHLSGELAVLYVRSPAVAPDEGWSVFSCWPAVRQGAGLPALAASVSSELLAMAMAAGVASGDARLGAWAAGLIFIRPSQVDRELMLCVHVPRPDARPGPSLDALRLLAVIPLGYEQNRQQRLKEREAARFAEALDIIGRVLEAENFDQAGLALVNGLAERFACEQVSLSWMAGEGLKVRAMSHSDILRQRTESSGLLEEVGQEALIQEQEITWPGPAKAVTHAHRLYAEARQPGHLLTLPLALGDTRLGAVVCERQRRAFSQSERWALRLLCDQATRPLQGLERRQRFLLTRLGREIIASLPRQLRPMTADGRRLGLLLVLMVVGLLLLPFPHRIEANFILKTDAMALIGAPFDGYIESSHVSLGAPVEAEAVVVTLATRELMLERAAGLADISQFSREVEKQRAANQLSEMRIAEAKLAQTQAKLEQVEYRLAQASVVSPIAGVVVEGEPGKNLGGPVKRGETMVKVARTEGLYAELAVTEQDVQCIAPGQAAEVMLVANPGQSWDMVIRRITPAPTVKDGHNSFPVRAETVAAHPTWWRPGMSGVAKISAGKRSLLWLMTHRLVDFLRLKLWI